MLALQLSENVDYLDLFHFTAELVSPLRLTFQGLGLLDSIRRFLQAASLQPVLSPTTFACLQLFHS